MSLGERTELWLTPLAEPVAAVEVTKMPLPQGRCAGDYTEEARAAATDLVAAARPSSG